MHDCGLGKGVRSEEELDLLQRSKKKKKTGDEESFEYVDVVMETPLSLAPNGGNKVPNKQESIPSHPRISFRDMVRSREASSEYVPRNFAGLYDEGSVSNDDEIDPDKEEPLCLRIYLTKAEKVRLRSPWRKTLIIKVMGKMIGYNFLLRHIQLLWHPSEDMELVAMDNDYYLVKFESMEDYNYAKFEGPWMIIEHYLIVNEWVSNFDPFTDYLKDVLVWERFPCLSIENYNSEFLMKLGARIGRPIKVDYATSVTSRGKFARLCVEVDLSKPLVPKFSLRNKVRKIEYEGLYLVCFKCGVYDHREETCCLGVGGEGRGIVSGRQNNTEETETFGPWMLASRRNRRVNKVQNKKRRRENTDQGVYHDNNPFMALENLEEVVVGLEQIEAQVEEGAVGGSSRVLKRKAFGCSNYAE